MTTNLEDETMSATTTNGRPRKQLSDQLDRLDGIIDAMSEGLNGAVADAAREGTRLAVKDAIIEIATNPELRALLAQHGPAPAHIPTQDYAPPVPSTPKPGLWAALKARLASARDAIGRAADSVTGRVVSRCRAARDGLAAVTRATGESLRVRRVLWIGMGIGLATGVVCLALPHTASAVVGATGTAATAICVQVGSWLRRAALRVGLV